MASPRTVPQAAAPVLVPGTDRPCPPPHILDTQSPQLYLSYYSLSVILYPLCVAVPPIPRPSKEQFINYAEERHRDQVTEALRYYPDLMRVQDEVGACDIVM